MNEVYSSIIIGLISGLITSGLLFIFHKVYLSIIKPWVANFLYRGIKLDGVWEGGLIRGALELRTNFYIKQNAFDLKGEFYAETRIKDKSEKDYSNQYKVKGFIKNNIVVLTYEALSEKRTGVGSFVFTISKGGQEMEGRCIHSEDQHKSFNIENIKIKRTN